MPLRGDFNIEYDNDAELLLADMEFYDDDKKSEQELKYEILKLYNAKLDERIRRKKFVVEKGLLDTKKQQQLERKRPKEEREIYTQMKPFMRFCEGDEFRQLVDGLIEERSLRQRLEELKLFRYLFSLSLLIARLDFRRLNKLTNISNENIWITSSWELDAGLPIRLSRLAVALIASPHLGFHVPKKQRIKSQKLQDTKNSMIAKKNSALF